MKHFIQFQEGKELTRRFAAARLGANVAMVGAVGDDNYGTVVRKNLENERVFIDYVVPVTDAATGIAHIVLAEEDNSIVVVQGANALVNESVVNLSKDLLIKADMVVLQLEIPLETVKYVLAICEEHKNPGYVKSSASTSVIRRYFRKGNLYYTK